MGQKTNANIFRLGLKKNKWNTKFFEKNKEDLSLLTFQQLEIKKYIKQFFKLNGLIVHNYKLNFTESTVYLFVSYFTTFKGLFLIQNKNQLKSLKKVQKIDRTALKNTPIKKSRLDLLKYYKKNLQIKKFSTKQILKQNNFSKILIENFNILKNQNKKITIIFQNLNKGSSLKLNKQQLSVFRKILLLLRKDSKHKFFKETINILLISIQKKKSAMLLADFIAFQLEKLTKTKRHKYFLIFLKKCLILLEKTNLCYITGIKIVVTGRLNSAPRTKKSNILIGKVPLQTIHKKIDFYQSVAYTGVGTLGVKVWINEG